MQLNAGEDRNEWFKCDVNAVKAAIIAVRDGIAKYRKIETQNIQK